MMGEYSHLLAFQQALEKETETTRSNSLGSVSMRPSKKWLLNGMSKYADKLKVGI